MLEEFWLLLNQPNIKLLHIEKRDAIDLEFLNQPFEKMSFKIVLAKKVDEGIKSCMDKENIDLLVFLKSNRSFWQRLYRSSITHKLLFQSRVPLLVFS